MNSIATYRGNFQRTGTYETSPLSRTPRLKWKMETPGFVECLIAADGIGCFGTGTQRRFSPAQIQKHRKHPLNPERSGGLHAVHLETGEPLWTFDAGSKVGCPTLVGDTLYFGTAGGATFALDNATQEVKWRHDVGAVSTTTVAPISACLNGIVYVGHPDGNGVLALDAQTGQSLWAQEETDSMRCISEGTDFALSDDTLFLSSFEGNHGVDFFAFDAVTGQTRWTLDIASGIDRVAAVMGDVAYVNEAGGCLYARRSRTGEPIWQYPTAQARDNDNEETVCTPSSVDRNIIVVGMSDGVTEAFYVTALETASGKRLWRYYRRQPLTTPPVMADGLALFSCQNDPHLYALDAQTGKRAWKFCIGGDTLGEPLPHNGVIYVGSNDGWLYALE